MTIFRIFSRTIYIKERFSVVEEDTEYISNSKLIFFFSQYPFHPHENTPFTQKSLESRMSAISVTL